MSKQEAYNALAEIIMDSLSSSISDIHEGNVRLGYSGRGMCGRECLGFVMPAHDFAGFNQDLLENLISASKYSSSKELVTLVGSLKKSMRSISTDSMGLDKIGYLQNFQIPDGVRSGMIEVIDRYIE